MKQFFKYAFVALLGMATIGCDRDGGADGVNGINGKDGINGKGILNGKGVPSASLGTIGDFYLDENTYNLYGPKSEKGWGNPIALIGEKGKDGADGEDAPTIHSGTTPPTSDIGNEGDFYIDLRNKVLYGPKIDGNWGDGIVMNNSLRGTYVLSADGKTLNQWLDKTITYVDMESDEVLKNVEIIANEAFRYTDLTQIVLPKKLKYIGRMAFANSNLEYVSIPNSVEYIGDRAFYGSKLIIVELPNAITSIGIEVFRGNQLTSIDIPNSVTSIGEGAFRNNELMNLVIPNSVTSMGREAFYSNKIKDLVISNRLENIPSYAFGYNRIEHLVIPNGVKVIGEQAFRDNSYLKSIEIAESVEEIDYYAFGNIYFRNLEKLVLKSKEPPMYYDKIYNIMSPIVRDITLYVPKGTKEAYTNSSWGNYFRNIVEQE